MVIGTSKRFEPIGFVFADKKGKVLRDAHDAAEVLIKEWPAEEGDEFCDAVKICLDVITGRTDPEHLRQAMLRAADEAGIRAIIIIDSSEPTASHPLSLGHKVDRGADERA